MAEAPVRPPSSRRRKLLRRRAIVDGMLAVVLLVMLGAIVEVGVESSRLDGERRYLENQAHELYQALDRYHERHDSFPGVSGPAIDPVTLEPLRRRGYYAGNVAAHLVAGRLDAYHAPAGGERDEYWLEMTLAADPAVRFVVARSDDAPLGGGRWLDGVYVYDDGKLSPL